MSDGVRPVEPDVRNNWKDVLIADRWRILGLALLVTGIAVLLGVDLSIPRWTRLFGVTFLVAAGIAYIPAARIVRWLYRPAYTFLVQLDAEDSDMAIWALPPTVWREIEVTDGELFPLQAAVPAWECRHYEPEENVATGTWRGSASDLELIQERGRIKEIRGVLEDLAKEGLGYRVMQSGIVRGAVRSVVLSFIETFERDAVYDGEEIRQAVDETLGEWEYDDEVVKVSDEVGDDGTLLADQALEKPEPETPPGSSSAEGD